MKRFAFWGMLLAVMTGLFLATGCSSNKTAQAPGQRVAGTIQQYKASMVTIVFSDTGITVTPATIPAGNVTVKVVNKSTVPQSLQIKGKGTNVPIAVLQPGKSTMLKVDLTKPGKYTADIPGMNGRKALKQAFTVTKPIVAPTMGAKPTPTTTTTTGATGTTTKPAKPTSTGGTTPSGNK